jgi:hypothetical protein
VISGPPKILISRADSAMVLSPDGRRLAFVGYGKAGRAVSPVFEQSPGCLWR